MYPASDNPASCKICTIHLLYTKNMSSAEIHSELCTVYGQNVMSEGPVKQWCRMLKEGRGQPSIVSDDLVESESQCFTISELSCLSQARLSQVLHKMGSENGYVRAQNTENGFSFDFFQSDTTKMAMNFSVASYEKQTCLTGINGITNCGMILTNIA
jgi:hypothetical protein